MNIAIKKPVKLTPIERQNIEAKCRNMLNWSDGGHWIGSGHKPNCFMRDNIKSSASHTYRFPTDSSATKWNLDWEKGIRYAGNFGTAILTVSVTAVTSGLIGIGVGTLSAVIKDEYQASITYPRMARGWSYELVFEHHFKWSPHPWGQRELIQTITSISRDHIGNEVGRTLSVKKYKLDELPDGLGRMLATSLPKKTFSDYQ